MDFKEFKKNRSKMAENINKLREEKENKNTDFSKDNYFPKPDANGNAYVTIRILPQKDMNKHPVQTNYFHRAKLGQKYLSLICPSTFGTMKDCKLCQEAGAEWSRLKEAGEDHPKVDAYRKKTDICNILVVKDKAQPELEGTVMKFYIPFPILEKLNNKLMPPKDADGNLLKPAEMVHDLWEGKNLNLEIRKDKRGYNDYSESQFEAEFTPVAKTEKEIEAIFNQLFDLEADKSKLFTNEQIIEKWNSFHALNGGSSLEEQKQSTEKKIEEKVQKVAEEKENTKKIEESFSNESVAETSNSDDDVSDSDDVLPW